MQAMDILQKIDNVWIFRIMFIKNYENLLVNDTELKLINYLELVSQFGSFPVHALLRLYFEVLLY